MMERRSVCCDATDHAGPGGANPLYPAAPQHADLRFDRKTLTDWPRSPQVELSAVDISRRAREVRRRFRPDVLIPRGFLPLVVH